MIGTLRKQKEGDKRGIRWSVGLGLSERDIIKEHMKKNKIRSKMGPFPRETGTKALRWRWDWRGKNTARCTRRIRPESC